MPPYSCAHGLVLPSVYIMRLVSLVGETRHASERESISTPFEGTASELMDAFAPAGRQDHFVSCIGASLCHASRQGYCLSK